MKEIDIWDKVLINDGFTFIDELSRMGSNINILLYRKNYIDYKLYFNFNTGDVSIFSCDLYS